MPSLRATAALVIAAAVALVAPPASGHKRGAFNPARVDPSRPRPHVGPTRPPSRAPGLRAPKRPRAASGLTGRLHDPRAALARKRAARADEVTDRAELRRAFAMLKDVDVLLLDMDNTVVDSRPRTAAAVREFARRRGAALSPALRRRLASVTVDGVGWGPEETSHLLRIPAAERTAFAAVWEELFKTPEAVERDRPIHETIRLARAAAARGIEVYFVTGRPTDDRPGDGAHRAASLAQLRRVGLPLASDDRLITRDPTYGIADFKRQRIAALTAGRRALFVDDSTANLDAVDDLDNVQLVAVDFSAREPGWKKPARAVELTIRPTRDRLRRGKHPDAKAAGP